jgi:hypothetical protein
MSSDTVRGVAHEHSIQADSTSVDKAPAPALPCPTSPLQTAWLLLDNIQRSLREAAPNVKINSFFAPLTLSDFQLGAILNACHTQPRSMDLPISGHYLYELAFSTNSGEPMVFYVGETTNLRHRLNDHITSPSRAVRLLFNRIYAACAMADASHGGHHHATLLVRYIQTPAAAVLEQILLMYFDYICNIHQNATARVSSFDCSCVLGMFACMYV